MPLPHPENSFIIYLWVSPSKEESLTKPIDEFLHFLELHSGLCSILIDRNTNSITPAEYPVLDFLYTDTYQGTEDSLLNLHPFVITNLSQFESEKETIIHYLKRLDHSCLPKEILSTSSLETILSKQHYPVFEEKKRAIENQLELAESLLTERPQHLHSHLTTANKLLNQLDSHPSFIQNSQLSSFSSFFFYELYSLLLSAQVEIAYFIYAGIDPINGWIHHQKSNSKNTSIWEIRNPFLSISNNLDNHGAISRIEYFPRKFLLNNTNNSFIFSLLDQDLNDDSFASPVKSVQPAPYRIMRNQPDLFAIRFDETLETNYRKSKETLTCSKVFYIRSGLGSFIPNSTTGFTCEYWLEGEKVPEENILLNLYFPLLFPASHENIKIRALSSFGGENELLYSINKETPLNLNEKKVAGNLFGIRIIHTINHFIIDLRFSKRIEGVSIKADTKDEETTLLNLNFRQHACSLLGYEALQAIHFCIY
jgi:hypothetical protein